MNPIPYLKKWRRVAATLAVSIAAYAPAAAQDEYNTRGNVLIGRAVLPAATFAPGPTSGQYLGLGPINKQPLPFVNKQPVQGFSAVLDNQDGTYLALSDNGFGNIVNSADYHLRVYTIQPRFERKKGGKGDVKVRGFIELSDPDKKIPFAIVNHFTKKRILTGADFDLESFQKTADGTLWFGDEFGPFLIHTDAQGKVLEAPIALPDFDNEGKEIRAAQNPYSEEISALRIMNAVRTHARINKNTKTLVISPWFPMLDDGNPATASPDRANPPANSGLARASSEIFNVASLKSAGYPVVPYTINDTATMRALIRLGVNGIISDRPDLLREVVFGYDGNRDGKPDFVDADGLIDGKLFDAQGHRGSRGLRPENTLPAMEAALDNLMATLETDCGITKDGVPVLDHDPHVEAAKVRRADGQPYVFETEAFVKDLTAAEIQSTFIADKLLPGFLPAQTNDRSLSPVAVAFALENGLPDPYVLPTLQQLFDFVAFYVTYYQSGPGSNEPDAEARWKNAQRVRFNVETKINPRTDADAKGDVFAERTVDAETFAKAVADVIVKNNLTDRADIQSFDFRTLLITQEKYPQIRTVYLFGDFPKIGSSSDGTNLQDQDGRNTPWLAGLYWPYRTTALSNPFRARTSGGFEGMAYDRWANRLLPLLEQPLVGSDPKTLLIHAFDLAKKAYTGTRYPYVLEARGAAIGEFTLFSPQRGVIIERDGSQGNLQGFKTIQEVELGEAGKPVGKRLAVDLVNIQDRARISEPGLPGDVGLGETFAFPFTTIESVVVLDEKRIGVVNDNNFPFSVGRHVGDTLP
ncbi:MAG: esterase-like activity of phytase family protein, partial [Ferruginibacter sp.]|nr:esterase-like activity of phytase family protein [Cytophagales bacterium]